jgi:hypothetical protein
MICRGGRWTVKGSVYISYNSNMRMSRVRERNHDKVLKGVNQELFMLVPCAERRVRPTRTPFDWT